jgi:hypothetical protein
VQKRAEQAAKAIHLNEIRVLGVVAEDLLVCYAATLQKLKLETREETTAVDPLRYCILRIKLSPPTCLRRMAVNSISELLAKQRSNVSRLQRANRN